MKKPIYYAAYKGDAFLDLGTAEELANKLKMKVETLKFHTRPVYKRRVKEIYSDNLIVIKIEED